MKVVYLHGRSNEPETPPGDLVHAAFWPDLRAPWLDDRWLVKPFSRQVDIVERWLTEKPVLAIGFGWGAYLLLAAVLQRIGKGAETCPLLLLSPVLGRGAAAGSHGKTIGFLAPRAPRVRGALGLADAGSGPSFPPATIDLVRGEEDPTHTAEEIRLLAERGYGVTSLPGGGALESDRARAALNGLFREYASSWSRGPGQEKAPPVEAASHMIETRCVQAEA